MSEALGSDGPSIVLTIRNREPLSLGTLASLLEAMAKDYGHVTGRALVLRTVRQGSTIVDLVDLAKSAVEGMEAVVAIKEFVGLIRKVIGLGKEPGGALSSTRSPGVKTVRELIKVSRGSHADIEILYKSEGEHIEVRLTRPEAEQLHLRQAEARRTAPPARQVVRPVESDLRDQARVDQIIGDFAKAAAVIHDDPMALEASGNASFALAKAMVLELRSLDEGSVRIERMSSALRAQGQRAAADLLDYLAAI